MASVFGHVASIIGITKLFPDRQVRTKAFILGTVSSVIPDLDVICYSFGIDGTSTIGHRGITHSIMFAILWAILICWLFHKRDILNKITLVTYYFSCTISHGLLDAMTTGGDGIAFFAPFHSVRSFLPWRFIEVSPIGARNFFSEWGLQVLKNEFLLIGIPSMILFAGGVVLNKYYYK